LLPSGQRYHRIGGTEGQKGEDEIRSKSKLNKTTSSAEGDEYGEREDSRTSRAGAVKSTEHKGGDLKVTVTVRRRPHKEKERGPDKTKGARGPKETSWRRRGEHKNSRKGALSKAERRA